MQNSSPAVCSHIQSSNVAIWATQGWIETWPSSAETYVTRLIPHVKHGHCWWKLSYLDRTEVCGNVAVCLCEPAVWPSGKALGWQKGIVPVLLRLSFLFKKPLVYCGHCLVTLAITANETLKWLSSLTILMQELFWWWQCSDRYIISLFPHLHTPFPPTPSPY